MRKLNKLLAVLRAQKLCVPCDRVYTTAYKDGVSFRVKFYGTHISIPLLPFRITRDLRKLGWMDISIENVESPYFRDGQGCISFLVKATLPLAKVQVSKGDPQLAKIEARCEKLKAKISLLKKKGRGVNFNKAGRMVIAGCDV